MKKQFSILIALLLVAFLSVAQNKKTAPPLSLFEAKLKATKFPYEKVNDSTAVIPFKGTEIAAYEIVIVKTANLYVLLCNISNSIPGIELEKNYKRLLEMNNDLDLVKFSIEKDSGKIFVRIDAYASNLSAEILKNLINQIGDAVDYAAEEFK